MDGANGTSGTPAPVSAPSTPSGGAAPSAPAGGGGPPKEAAAKQPILYRPKDADRDFDITEAVEEHLRGHRRKIVIDGQESEVDIEAAFRAASLEPASKRRFSEADRLRKQAESEVARVRAADAAMSDPARIPAVLAKRMGREKYEDFILAEAKGILDFEKLTPQQRQAAEASRKRAEEFEAKAAKLAQDQAEIERQKKANLTAQQKATNERVRREWPPMLESLGVPKGMVDYAMREMVREIRESQKFGVNLTEKEAAQRCAAELRRRIGATAAPAPDPAKVERQPGRQSEEAPKPRDPEGKFRKNGTLRPDDLRARIEKL